MTACEDSESGSRVCSNESQSVSPLLLLLSLLLLSLLLSMLFCFSAELLEAVHNSAVRACVTTMEVAVTDSA
eukprot:1072435-Amphidinium_carterae.1